MKSYSKIKEHVDELSALLSMQSAKEREERSQQEEILTLLKTPTAKEKSLMNIFKSQVRMLMLFKRAPLIFGYASIPIISTFSAILYTSS